MKVLALSIYERKDALFGWLLLNLAQISKTASWDEVQFKMDAIGINVKATLCLYDSFLHNL